MECENRTDDPLTVLAPERVDASCRQALEENDREGAIAACITSLRTGTTRLNRADSWLALERRNLGEEEYLKQRRRIADDALEQRYVGVYDVVHEFTQGIDWHYDPTATHGEKQTNEWTWQFNRHLHWVALAEMWEYSGDPRYARAWEKELWSWLTQCPRPYHAGTQARSAWRPIETAIRTAWRWPTILEIFRRCSEVSDEALWAFVVSFQEHGRHLLEHPAGNNNMQAMICNGLTHIGCVLPELALAYTFSLTGLDRAIGQLERQIYPDGLEDELSPGYGRISFRNLYQALKIVSWARPREAGVVPPRAWQRVGDIIEALGKLAAPDGVVPPIHDSPPVDMRPVYAELEKSLDMQRFSQLPWRNGESYILPWGGFTVMRAGTDDYALLDAGPLGTSHAHDDALQVLIHAGARWLLADAGKPRYDASAIKDYLKSSAAHNVVLMDDQPHQAMPAVSRASEPFPIAYASETPLQFAVARRGAQLKQNPTQGFTHERALCGIAGLGWVVFDRLCPADDKEHKWYWLWHSPVRQVAPESNGGVAYDHASRLFYLRVAGSHQAETAISCGESEGRIRGWQSQPDTCEPTPMSTFEIIMPGRNPWLFTLFTLRHDVDLSSVWKKQDRYTAGFRVGEGNGRLSLGGEDELTTVQWESPEKRCMERTITPHSLCHP